MNFLKKQSAGFYFSAIVLVLTLAGLTMYLKNSATDYFSNLGKDPVILGCLIAAAVAELLWIVLSQKGTKKWMDLLPVAVSVLLFLGGVLFAGSRVNGIASIMTFENNAQTMADLSSAISGIALCLISGVVSIVASFFDITKEA